MQPSSSAKQIVEHHDNQVKLEEMKQRSNYFKIVGWQGVLGRCLAPSPTRAEPETNQFNMGKLKATSQNNTGGRKWKKSRFRKESGCCFF